MGGLPTQTVAQLTKKVGKPCFKQRFPLNKCRLRQNFADTRLTGFDWGHTCLAPNFKETAQKMLKKGFDFETIMDLTGLTLSEIEALEKSTLH